jgi:carboxylesterase
MRSRGENVALESTTQSNNQTLAHMGVLLIHGLERGPEDYADVAAHLAERGALIDAMLLPGHGVSAREGRTCGWPEWSAAVREHAAALAQQRSQLILIGHSLGGVLALDYAAHHPDVTGIASLCAPMHVRAMVRVAAALANVVWPYYWKATEDNGDPETLKTYQPHWVAWRPLRSLLRTLPSITPELAQVRCPALILGARNDRVVAWEDAKFIADHIASSEKSLVILPQSHHVVLKDVDREQAVAAILAFVTGLAQ